MEATIKEAIMAKIALCDARGPLNALNDVLAGEDGDRWLEALKRVLRKENPWGGLFAVSYDQSLGLRRLIERAVGPRNHDNINGDITADRFKLAGTGVRTVNLRVEAYIDNKTSERAAARLTAAGIKLASTGDLAGFQHDHPGEVEKWAWVLALSEDSRWTNPDGFVFVPCAHVDGASRDFNLFDFRCRLNSDCGVLVLCE